MRARIALLVAGTLLLCTSTGSAFCRRTVTGGSVTVPIVAWQVMPIEYRISSNASAEVKAAIDAAFATWAAVPCSKLAFTKGADFDITATAFELNQLAIHVFWFDAANSANWPSNPANYAHGWLAHDNGGGLDAFSIGINAFNEDWNTTGGDNGVFDVQNVMTYLIGLAIGLDESTTAGAVMYEDELAYNQVTKRTLTDDDKNAAVSLYPENDGCTAPPPADDCASGPITDGGTTTGDGGTPLTDGGTPLTDGGTPLTDGGTPLTDGGTPLTDGGTPLTDGGTPVSYTHLRAHET